MRKKCKNCEHFIMDLKTETYGYCKKNEEFVPIGYKCEDFAPKKPS